MGAVFSVGYRGRFKHVLFFAFSVSGPHHLTTCAPMLQDPGGVLALRRGQGRNPSVDDPREYILAQVKSLELGIESDRGTAMGRAARFFFFHMQQKCVCAAGRKRLVHALPLPSSPKKGPTGTDIGKVKYSNGRKARSALPDR